MQASTARKPRTPPGRLNVYMPHELRSRVQRVAAVRKTKEAATLRLLIERGLQWWEELPIEQREAV